MLSRMDQSMYSSERQLQADQAMFQQQRQQCTTNNKLKKN